MTPRPSRSRPHSRRTPWLMARAVALVALGSILQRFVAMPRWSGLLGKIEPVPQNLPSMATPTSRSDEAERLSAVIATASRVVPWTVSCLAQAFAGQQIAKSAGQSAAVVIGLKKDSSPTWQAHAWLVTHGQIVSGGAIAGEYSPVSVHVWGDVADALGEATHT